VPKVVAKKKKITDPRRNFELIGHMDIFEQNKKLKR